MKRRRPPRDPRSRDRRRRTAAAFLAPAAVAALLAAGDPAAVFAAEAPAAIARATATRPSAALQAEAEHPNPERRIRLASALPDALAAMSDLERARFVMAWATSPSGRLRLAIARALRYAPRAAGCIAAIELLAGDRDAAVRVATAEAAWLRRREHPPRLIAVLHRLSDDDHPFVREVARLALGDA